MRLLLTGPSVRVRRWSLPLLAAIILGVLAPGAAIGVEDAGTAEDGLVARINDERARRGLSRLAVTDDLVAVARAHSDRMAALEDLHHNHDLSRQVDGWRLIAENVGVGSSASEIHRALMNSTGHRANILNSAIDHIGVGVTVSGGRLWVTQVFRDAASGWGQQANPRPASISTFSDVAVTSPHAAAIEALAELGITSGCNDDGTRYCPGAAVNRGQLATLLATAFDVPDASGSPFRDVPGTHAPAVASLAAAGVTSGCAPDRYCPDAPVSRAQLATLIAELLDLRASGGVTFDDVPPAHAAGVAALVDAGIASGCSATRFCASDAVSRAQLATILDAALRR